MLRIKINSIQYVPFRAVHYKALLVWMICQQIISFLILEHFLTLKDHCAVIFVSFQFNRLVRFILSETFYTLVISHKHLMKLRGTEDFCLDWFMLWYTLWYYSQREEFVFSLPLFFQEGYSTRSVIERGPGGRRNSLPCRRMLQQDSYFAVLLSLRQ